MPVNYATLAKQSVHLWHAGFITSLLYFSEKYCSNDQRFIVNEQIPDGVVSAENCNSSGIGVQSTRK
jgi:hypothetical protein